VKYKPLLKFMLERHKMWIRRFEERAPKPWTKDRILQSYRFCNVYRELDTVTIWIRQHIREPYADHPNLWFMLCMARQINWPATLQEIMEEGGWPKRGYDWQTVRAIMLARQARGDQLYTGAYMLNAHGTKPDDPKDKAFFTTKYVLNDLWTHRDDMKRVLADKSLEKTAAFLKKFHGWAGFTSAQTVADIKYTKQLEGAEDWWSWAAPGPGSIRGLNVVMGREIDAKVPAAQWLSEVNTLRAKINDQWPHEALHAQDMQNCLCEYFKYTRGWSRSRYDGLPS
jgi:hypothetical protein